MKKMIIEDAEDEEEAEGRQEKLRSKLPAQMMPDGRVAAASKPTASDPAEAIIIDNKFAPLKSPWVSC